MAYDKVDEDSVYTCVGHPLRKDIENIVYWVLNDSFTTAYNSILSVPYFFCYKMEFFSFQNNTKYLDLSYQTDLDLWDCLGRVKLIL